MLAVLVCMERVYQTAYVMGDCCESKPTSGTSLGMTTNHPTVVYFGCSLGYPSSDFPRYHWLVVSTQKHVGQPDDQNIGLLPIAPNRRRRKRRFLRHLGVGQKYRVPKKLQVGKRKNRPIHLWSPKVASF